MKTKEQIKQEFMQDLKALLEKYDAKISAEEYRDGCPHVVASLQEKYSDAGVIISEECEIDLGIWIEPSDF